MSTDPLDEPHRTAIEQLEAFGLSTYAARTFVALATLETGTAREISEASAVPRTRVYDAVDELQDRGLADVQESTPREYWAISAETASSRFSQEMDQRSATLRRALGELEPMDRGVEQRGVFTVDGQAAVTERVLEFVERATDEIVYMTVEDLLTDRIVDALRAADDRGVSITLAGISPDVQARIQADIPGAELADSLWVWSDTPAGRLMLVDGRTTFASVLVNGPEAPTEDPRSETAIWGQGENNSLVVVLVAIFAWRLGEDASPDGD